MNSKTKITEEYIKDKIKDVRYEKLGNKTTMCFATLENGFELITASACVKPENFNYEIGKEIAYKRMIDKVWELEGYLFQEVNYLTELNNLEDE